MRIVIFEDHVADNFYPLSQTRALWDLRFGLFTFRERIERLAAREYPGSTISFIGRAALKDLYRELEKNVSYNEPLAAEDILLVNAVCAPHSLVCDPGSAYVRGTRLALALVSGKNLSSEQDRLFDRSWAQKHALSLHDLPQKTPFPDQLWQIPLENGAMIERDFALFSSYGIPELPSGVTFLGDPDRIYVGRNVVIDPFVVLDARKGAIVIEDGCQINSFTRVEGPCAVGRDCVVLGAKLREGCSFGPVCRIGGEVEEAVFQDHSNKYHDGFIGHAYIGAWVNLGALTSNSDLKNDYSTVKVTRPCGTMDTGETKVGCMIGDFVKTSIGTLINTGSVLGTGSFVVMSGRMTPPHLPSFCRFLKNEIRDPGGAEGIIATAKTACQRRKASLPAAMERILDTLYGQGANARKEELHRWNDALK